jgi:hypothetical protein
VQLLAEGRGNQAVAAALGISVKTAETHRAAILRKLGLGSLAGWCATPSAIASSSSSARPSAGLCGPARIWGGLHHAYERAA